MQHNLTVSPRDVVGKSVAKLASDGIIPAIIYGPKQAPVSVSIPLLPLEAILRHGGESSLIELSGLEKPIKALIHDLDRDPVTHAPRHVDFYAIEKGAKVTVSVALAFVGESMAMKQGANLVKILHEIEIETDPSNIPTEIEVDISSLASVDDQIHVSDVKAPEGVTILTPGEEVLALAQAVAEEVEEETATPDMDAIEVEKKGKTEEEEA
ncbi:MAG TPA: 50S ribosomal protein L25 [Candidatus Paceibacterota bacterium]|nr:50S ribosomal protein L25 [Candidatus Paceibacterota bacterium]